MSIGLLFYPDRVIRNRGPALLTAGLTPEEVPWMAKRLESAAYWL